MTATIYCIDMWLCDYMEENKITGLKAQKNKNRVNVFINNEFAFGLERDVAAWLRIGQIVSNEKIKELKENDTIEVAYRKAVNFIAYRQRTEFEVKNKLKTLGYGEEVICNVSSRLKTAGLIDDVRFAELWIESRCNSKPRGYRLLDMELKRKGIEEGIIKKTMNNVEDEITLAKKAVEKKLWKFKNLNNEDKKKKLIAHLTYRGFSYGSIRTVIDEMIK